MECSFSQRSSVQSVDSVNNYKWNNSLIINSDIVFSEECKEGRKFDIYIILFKDNLDDIGLYFVVFGFWYFFRKIMNLD